VIASHVIEHTPDLVTWLAEIRAILQPNGTLRLAIPTAATRWTIYAVKRAPTTCWTLTCAAPERRCHG
jgi:predicted SAM-dependent methyltransferase